MNSCVIFRPTFNLCGTQNQVFQVNFWKVHERETREEVSWGGGRGKMSQQLCESLNKGSRQSAANSCSQLYHAVILSG